MSSLSPKTRTEKLRRLHVAQGIRTPQHPVDMAATLEHLAALRATGLSVDAIAALSGVPRATIGNLAYPSDVNRHRKGILPATRDRILAIPLWDFTHVPDRYSVSATGTERRLRALVAIGYTGESIAAELGVSYQRIGALTRGRRCVTARLNRRISDLYERQAHIPGPSPLAAKRARSKGWATALAWEDQDIEDPATQPLGVLNRGSRTYKIADEIRAMAADGHKPAAIARELGCHQRTVERALQRHQQRSAA
jgi:DNA-binding CsgD family transcriptional regulator